MPKTMLAIGILIAMVLVYHPQANGAIHVFEAFLDGPSESPPNASPGTGYATFKFDDVLHTMLVHVEFSDLIGTTTVAHIHSATAVAGTGTAGVATTVPTFAGFPIGVTSGLYDSTLDMAIVTSYNPAFVTANGGTAATAEAALLSGMMDGKSYLNLHTSVFPGGELRGFLAPAVPEPTSLMIWSLFGLAVGAGWWRRRKQAA